MVMRLHGHDISYLFTLIPETADLLGLREVERPDRWDPPSYVKSSPRYRGLTTIRTVFFAPVVGTLNRS